MAANGETQGAQQVRIQLWTRQPDLELAEKPGPILVSTRLNRRALSSLVNQLLSTPKDRPVPFEILIDGIFLRNDIDSYLNANGVSAETTLSVEYTRALLPPVYQSSFEHDDWVSSVDVLSSTSPSGAWTTDGVPSGQPRIVTGSFDGLVRVWHHSGSISATSCLSSTISPSQVIYNTKFLDSNTIVSSGFGVPVRIWSYDEASDGPSPDARGRLTPQLDLYGHSHASLGLAVHGPSRRILSAGDDGTAALFSSDLASGQPSVPSHCGPAVPRTGDKRRKTSSTDHPPRAGPLAVLSGHTSSCTAAIFHPNDSTAAYTTSKDRTLRTWDLVTAASVAARTPQPGHQLTCIASLPRLGLLAAGSVGERISLVDPREGAARAAVMTLVGFRNAVAAVAASPDAEHGLAGASHDGTVRVFDVRGGSDALAGVGDGAPGLAGRTTRQAFKISRDTNDRCDRVVGGEGVKVFDVCWDGEVGIVSVSEDKRAQINRVAQ